MDEQNGAVDDNMKIAICSSTIEAQKIKHWLREQEDAEYLQLFVYQRVEQLVASYKVQLYYDLIFLAVYTEEQPAMRLRQLDKQAAIVLLADDTQYLMSAFELEADAYLMRPLQQADVVQAFRRCRERFLQRTPELCLLVRGLDGCREPHVFTPRDIFYVESQMRKLHIHTIDQQQYAYYGRISELEEQLPHNQFFRIHKGCLVNLRYLCYIGVDSVGLVRQTSGDMITLPLSRRRRDFLKEAVTAGCQ